MSGKLMTAQHYVRQHRNRKDTLASKGWRTMKIEGKKWAVSWRRLVSSDLSLCPWEQTYKDLLHSDSLKKSTCFRHASATPVSLLKHGWKVKNMHKHIDSRCRLSTLHKCSFCLHLPAYLLYLKIQLFPILLKSSAHGGIQVEGLDVIKD